MGILGGSWEFLGTMGNLPCLYFTVPILKLHEALYMLSELSKLPELLKLSEISELSELLPSSKEVHLFRAFRVGDQLSEAPGAKVYLIEL